MGVLEIPDQLYQAIYQDEVARLVREGVWLDAARARAAEIMQHCFVARSAQIQCESQKDYYEYEEEMSLGGRPYRVPR